MIYHNNNCEFAAYNDGNMDMDYSSIPLLTCRLPPVPALLCVVLFFAIAFARYIFYFVLPNCAVRCFCSFHLVKIEKHRQTVVRAGASDSETSKNIAVALCGSVAPVVCLLHLLCASLASTCCVNIVCTLHVQLYVTTRQPALQHIGNNAARPS